MDIQQQARVQRLARQAFQAAANEENANAAVLVSQIWKTAASEGFGLAAMRWTSLVVENHPVWRHGPPDTDLRPDWSENDRPPTPQEKWAGDMIAARAMDDEARFWGTALQSPMGDASYMLALVETCGATFRDIIGAGPGELVVIDALPGEAAE